MIKEIKKNFRLSNTARKIFWVAQIFDATLPNFTNGRAITPPPCPPVSYAYVYNKNSNGPKTDPCGTPYLIYCV